MSIRSIAIAALREHGGKPEKATAAFVQAARKAGKLNELALVYLRMIASQGITDAVATGARSEAEKPVSPRVAAVLSAPRSNVTPIDAARRSPSRKLAARGAMAESVEAVYEMEFDGRKLGRVRFGELITMKTELIDSAASMLEHGKKFIREAVLAGLIHDHCVAADDLAEVRTLINPKRLAALVAQAEREAPKRLAEATRRAAEAMATPKELAR